MNDYTIAMIAFKKIAFSYGCKNKVAGDNAFSSKKIGQGKYIRLKSCINGKLTYWFSEGSVIRTESI